MTASKPTAWMWVENDTVFGVTLDVRRGQLLWQDQIGCHCAGEDDFRQSAESYRSHGAPPQFSPPPADIAAEIADALTVLVGEAAA